ncbi:MAG: alpha/beta hydrolase, partial [Candidatus Helarchaeales archaeon]
MSEIKSLQNTKTWHDYCFGDFEPAEIEKVVREDFIQSQGKKIHLDIYETNEKTSKPTIIFVHGTAVYARFYADFLFHMNQKGYRIVAPDLPGHGLSEGKRGH